MKKLYMISMAIVALMFASCEKESRVEVPVNGDVVKTFTVQTPESTKTTTDGTKVYWAAGDAIRVFGYTDGSPVASAKYEIKSGFGSSTAEFELADGESMGTYDEYYALYPYSVVSSFSADAAEGIMVSSGLNVDAQTAVENGFDPAFALMTAKADGDGKLVFRHGASYFKVTIPDDGITKVKITFGKNAVQKRPYYSPSDGSINKNNGGTADIAATGSFVKGSSYYIAAIPNTSNKMVSLKISMTKGIENSITSTSSLLDAKIALGEVYNLGTPPISFSPVINPVAPAKLEADATNGSFTYTVVNPDGVSTVSAVKKSGDWITAVDDSVDGTISFTCTANTGAERTGVITLSYTGADDVDVTITQKAQGGGAESHVRKLYYKGSTITESNDGVESELSFFDGTIAKAALTSNYAGTVTIDEVEYSNGIKMNSTGTITFTTSATLNTTVRFYAVRKNSGDTSAKMQIFPTGNTSAAHVFDVTPYSTTPLDTGDYALEKGTAYTIKQSKNEQAVILVIINETE